MKHKRLTDLFRRYYVGQLSAVEESEFFLLVKEATDEELANLTQSAWEETEMQQAHFTPDISRQIFDTIMADRLAAPEKPRVRRWLKVHTWFAAASAAILVVAATAMYFLEDRVGLLTAKKNLNEFEIFAGGNQIILTDGEGRKLVLDSSYNAIYVASDGLRYGQSTDDENPEDRRYATRIADADHSIAWHTLTVPRGSQYNVTLSDGTRVWLNAASSIRFPSTFSDNQRVIELNGEAYLEVERDPDAPFSVIYDGGKVDVLGTRFNLRAYEGQPVQAALLSGAIRMAAATTTATLAPGQIAIAQKGDIVISNHTSIEHAIAWKSGLFFFEDTDVQTILRDMERWYDITVVYAGRRPTKRLTGTISQQVPLAEVLHILRFAGINCTFENRNLTVL